MIDDRTTAPPSGGDPPTARHERPRGAGFMNVVRWVLFGGLLLLAAISIGSYIAAQRSGRDVAARAGQPLYHCPMHPTFTSTDPKAECPICGMSLEPVRDGGTGGGPDGDVPGLVGVHLSPERTQMIGVRTARAERRPLGEKLELVGFVTPDEARLRRVQLRVAGWVQDLAVNRTGERIAAGQPLLTLYSPELYQSEREFLIELAAHAGGGAQHSGTLAAARERLALLGVPREEIERLERERAPVTHLALRAPVTGTVLERGVVEGQYVGPETPLLTLADLSRVWVLADLYEMDFARLRVGDEVVFTADALPGRPYTGRVEFVYPTVAAGTRTLKARLSLANPSGDLRPGMFGRVRVAAGGPTVLAVPAEAVVFTGELTYVFVAHAGGHFEPRAVEVGGRDPDWIEIRRGLAEGEAVVASASFLIDSESRLKAAIAGMGAQPGAHAH